MYSSTHQSSISLGARWCLGDTEVRNKFEFSCGNSNLPGDRRPGYEYSALHRALLLDLPHPFRLDDKGFSMSLDSQKNTQIYKEAGDTYQHSRISAFYLRRGQPGLDIPERKGALYCIATYKIPLIQACYKAPFDEVRLTPALSISNMKQPFSSSVLSFHFPTPAETITALYTPHKLAPSAQNLTMDSPFILVAVSLVILLQTLYFLRPFQLFTISRWAKRHDTRAKSIVNSIKATADCHEVAGLLTALIQEDGAGSWPPRANHRHHTWPIALQPYKQIYLELAPLLPQHKASLDHETNRARIANFRSQFRKQLAERVDLSQVRQLLEAAESGRWDVFPRDVYNAFYCCIASSRHAYRWATIPVVSTAQLEQTLTIPAELEEPWDFLQRHFGCPSDSGNNMSNLVLNFDSEVGGEQVFKINTGMPVSITSAEEHFARIFFDIEQLALPIYNDVVQAIIAFARDDKACCARHMATISAQLRPALDSYYNRVHDKTIPLSIWLSRVQGFFAWGAGRIDDTTGEWEKFDGLSGNQILLFQVLDAFLGMEQYLSARDQERNVPLRQRAFCKAVEKYSFRGKLNSPNDEIEMQILREFDAIIKRLRVRLITMLPSPG